MQTISDFTFIYLFQVVAECHLFDVKDEIIVKRSYSSMKPAVPNYVQAAIRTQPKDLLLWSAAYFRLVYFTLRNNFF